MTYKKFNSLALERQANVVCKEGVLLGERTTACFEIYLFAVDGFYVEVFYNTRNQITFFEAFDNPSFLHLYLKAINLNGLF